jgi:cysteine-rich secretory family protein
VRTVVAALVVALIGALAMPGAVAGTGGPEDFAGLTNADRSAHGLPPLSTSRDIQAFAQRRAEEMAAAGDVWHTRNLGSYISNWTRLGENVGMGPFLSDIENGFMNSSTHRNNILSPKFSQMGVGVASDGYQQLYVAVIFREPAPVPAPIAAPAAAPGPRPTRPAPSRPVPVIQAAPAPPPPPAPAPEAAPPPAPVPEPPVQVEEPAARPLAVMSAPFLAANTWDSALPAPAVRDLVLALNPALAGSLLGMLVATAVVHAAWRRRLRLALVPRPALCGAHLLDVYDLPIG